jgi:DNA-binding Xre family transcriptional regulator
MAKIHEETVVITLSKLVKDNAQGIEIVATNDICEALQSVAEELLGSGVVVEVVRA